MSGILLKYEPMTNGIIFVAERQRRPTLKALQDIVEGYIELVPYFTRIKYEGKWLKCEVYCNEMGKLTGKTVNWPATTAWNAARRYLGMPQPGDVLLGNVAVWARM